MALPNAHICGASSTATETHRARLRTMSPSEPDSGSQALDVCQLLGQAARSMRDSLPPAMKAKDSLLCRFGAHSMKSERSDCLRSSLGAQRKGK